MASINFMHCRRGGNLIRKGEEEPIVCRSGMEDLLETGKTNTHLSTKQTKRIDHW